MTKMAQPMAIAIARAKRDGDTNWNLEGGAPQKAPRPTLDAASLEMERARSNEQRACAFVIPAYPPHVIRERRHHKKGLCCDRKTASRVSENESRGLPE